MVRSGLLAIDGQAQACTNKARAKLGGDLFGFEVERLPPSPIARFADLTFAGYMGDDGCFGSIGKGEDLPSGRTP